MEKAKTDISFVMLLIILWKNDQKKWFVFDFHLNKTVLKNVLFWRMFLKKNGMPMGDARGGIWFFLDTKKG